MRSDKNQRTPRLAAHFCVSAVVVWMLLALATSCVPKYTFNGASIDYTKTKTIQIADFPIRSAYVWGPMGPMFNNALKDQFANHTKLQQVRRDGDLQIEGEITQYQQRNKSVSSEGYAAQTELSITVNVRFTNNVNLLLPHHAQPQRRAARAGGADGQGSDRPDIQCHRGQLVALLPTPPMYGSHHYLRIPPISTTS